MAKSPRSGKGGGGRAPKVRVRTAKGRRIGSTRWLERQLNDPYVRAARDEGYRSRAAYKLLELDERHRLLKRGLNVLDLGAAPGGWSQVVAAKIGAGEAGGGRLLSVDIQEMEAVPGGEVLIGDIFDDVIVARIRGTFPGGVDLVLSDMAPSATGHKTTDHLRIIGLVEGAALLAEEILVPGGGFVAKVWQGGADTELLAHLKRCFRQVRHVKPPASRKESAEIYLLASGFRGTAGAEAESPLSRGEA